ncbi:MAG: TonB-dependent receptor [Comamonadaceae bacterium]|nr:MAG: TonB-dependent receptor [Comamonadaceae bacterium]
MELQPIEFIFKNSLGFSDAFAVKMQSRWKLAHTAEISARHGSQTQAIPDIDPILKPQSMISNRFLERSMCVLLATHVAQASATSPLPPPSLSEVVVVGVRASLASAQDIKRDKLEIVDAIVADDITKLPDFSVTDALQRVTGLQMARDRGDGTGITIRGLTQMLTTLNGQEIFTAGTGRNFDFADMASEMVAGIDVYKTSSADHIEGGIGGMINLRTRLPFDFKGREAVASSRWVHSDLAAQQATQFSALISNRWKTDGAGEFGALLGLAHQDRAFREDQKSTGNSLARTDLVAGQTVIAPNGISETTSIGQRQRTAANVALQWRPNANLELYAQGSSTRFETRQNSYQVNALASATALAGSTSLFPGTNDVSAVTWRNAPVSILSFARDTTDETQQFTLGGLWSRKALTLKSDLSYTKSSNTLFFSGLTLSGTAANFAQDLTSDIPGTSIRGTNLLDPFNFNYSSAAYRLRRFDGDQVTARLDGEYELSGGWLNTLLAGVRFANRSANNAAGLISADAAVTGISAAAMPQYTQVNPYAFFPGSNSIGSTLVGNPDAARDAAGLRRAMGITAAIPATASPLSLWNIQEETRAAYLMARFTAEGEPFHGALDGNFGLRVIHTHERVAGSQSVPATGAVAPLNIDSSYTDVLPSVNLRYQVSPALWVRASASQTLTRPNFDQLSPSMTLLQNTINPSLNQGNAGNPQLQPVRSNNLDLSLEKYINKTTSIHATGFLKKVDGFVTTLSSLEVIDGVSYQVSRPRNSSAADIKGLELGYQQFYDFLPGWMNGLGLQANYTYVDSATFDRTLGIEIPLQNFSQNSYNLIGMYEKGRLSARVAYNWRSKFLSGVTNVVGVGSLPIYTQAYGWLDASMSYRVSDKVSVVIAGTNLLRTVRSSYYGVETRPQSSWINDLQLSLGITARF